MLYGKPYPGDVTQFCATCEARNPSRAVECEFCGVQGCENCLELWSGEEQDRATGYKDEHWVCEDCQGKAAAKQRGE